MRRVAVALTLVMFAGCAAENGQVIKIRNIAAFSNTCSVSPTGDTFQADSSYDPFRLARPVLGTLGFSSVDGFRLPIRYTNEMVPGIADSTQTFNERELSLNPNDINITGVNACWLRGDDPTVSGLSSFDSGIPVDCDTLPDDQKAFLPASGFAQALGDGVTVVTLLTTAHLQAAAVYGSTYDPAQIQRLADVPTDTDGDGTTGNGEWDVIINKSPDVANRDGWGNFPQGTNNSDIIVVVQVVGKTVTGTAVTSNWFAHKVSICMGCLAGSCSNVIVGTPCDPLSTGAPTVVRLATSEPDFSSASICLPFQNFGSVPCRDINTCTDT